MPRDGLGSVRHMQKRGKARRRQDSEDESIIATAKAGSHGRNNASAHASASLTSCNKKTAPEKHSARTPARASPSLPGQDRQVAAPLGLRKKFRVRTNFSQTFDERRLACGNPARYSDGRHAFLYSTLTAKPNDRKRNPLQLKLECLKQSSLRSS